MYQLKEHQLKQVCGSEYVYVDEQWKQGNTIIITFIASITGAVLGGMATSFTFGLGVGALQGIVLGAAAGSGFGWAFAEHENSAYENGAWYWFEPDYGLLI